jgi:hypothetical protein
MAKMVTEGLPDQVAASLAAFLPGSLKLSVVTGGSANAELTLTGAATEDTIIGAFLIGKEGKASECVACASPTIPAAGKFKTSTATTEGKVIVLWADKSNG